IRTHVLTMGGLVEQQLSFAMQALHNDDIDLARRVVRDDHKVNAMEVSIDDACTRTWASSLTRRVEKDSAITTRFSSAFCMSKHCLRTLRT
ncbi:hypothetical protein JS84_25515, partial [Vibrio vulnificus]